ncbi:Armadillo-type fold [Pseudocohnilembus persalinus]|uniref:Armadillo-type fold n=1 Tax=Pseudocohnilembus persalinus TaxID=266149 RepID=A0A0V0QWT6_PSEPJ|nr:Armadillo-type fold [Pseudocohnilembus persalinus]|eukprot:KRX06686.1 Armadillo-type fold [Pseudocohnilembus persalinus]
MEKDTDHEENFKQLENQLLNQPKDTWNYKNTTQPIKQFSQNSKWYQQNQDKILDLEKKFIEKNCNFCEKADEKILAVINAFRDSHYSAAYQSSAKIQSTLVSKQLEMAAFFSEKTTEKGSYGDQITAAFLRGSFGLYEAFIKPANMKLAIPVVKNALTKNNGKLSDTLNTPCTTTLQYINMNAPKLITENAGLFWQIGLKTQNKSLITTIAGKCDNFKQEFVETIPEFLTFYEDELNSTEKIQCQTAISYCCEWAPEQCIKKVDLIMEELEGLNKYYGSQAVQKLAKKYPDQIYQHEQIIQDNLLNDKHLGYFGGQIYGTIGQYTNDEKIIKSCIQILLDAIQAEKVDQVFLLASGIKSIAQGGEKQKEILKKEFQSQLEKHKTSQNAQLSEQINQTLDIIHERSLEKVEIKMEELKQEMVDYVNSQIDTIKKNYNNAVKTLPMPVDIEVKKNIMNTIFLKFECAMCKDNQCTYPGTKKKGENFFKTKTREVNKWCKVASNVFSLGKSIFAGDIKEALGSLAETFTNATSDDQGATHFKALMEEPFLTSSEQDRLIIQLREAKYFDTFSFQAEVNGWVCNVCVPFTRSKAPVKQQQSCACVIF